MIKTHRTRAYLPARFPLKSGQPRWMVVGILLALPVSVQVVGTDLALAQGHRIARSAGFYLPLLSPVAGMLALVWSEAGAPFRALPRWCVRFAVALLLVMATVFGLGAVFEARFPLAEAALFLVQAAVPVLLFVALSYRTLPERAHLSLVRGFDITLLALATLLFLSRWIVDYDPAVGYLDDFGPFGIPTSLRFFPTTVAVAVASGAARLIAPATPRWERLLLGGLLTGSLALLSIAHSRTALGGVILVLVICALRMLRRHMLAVPVVLISASLLVGAWPVISDLQAVDRLVHGSGESDLNRLAKMVGSLEGSFESPVGQQFEPTVDARPLTGSDLQRVVTAEHQFGTYGVSAGPFAFVLSLLLVIALAIAAMQQWRTLQPARSASALALLVVLFGAFFQINLSQAHMGVLFAFFAWLGSGLSSVR